MPSKTTTEPRRKKKAKEQKIHCALIQKGIVVDDRIMRSIKAYEVVIHKITDIDEILTHCQRTKLEMIVIASDGSIDWMMDFITRIKRDSTLQFLPIIMFHPALEKDLIIDAYRCGVDEVLTDLWDYDLITAKMEMIINRSKRDLGVNPTTKLPGPSAIEQEINERLYNKDDIAICYVDLDNFKAYNDYHGYVYGDKIILLVSYIIRNTVHDLVDNGFIGHIGGDDYVFIIPYSKVDIVCKNIIDTFDRVIPYRYSDADREIGYIDVINRQGEMERFPIMTVSIAVIRNQQQLFTHVGEISHMMADLKKYTKTLPGSNYMIERRKKY